MKVIHLVSEKTWRGGEQQVAYLAKELKKAGVENIIICREDSAFEKWCIQNDLTFYSIPFKNSFDLSSVFKIKQIAKKEKADLIHMHSAKAHALAVISAFFGNKVPLILSRRVDFPVKDNFFSLWKYNHSSIKKILCVSDKIKEITVKSIKDKSKCITVHSGIDLTKFENVLSDNLLRKEFNLEKSTILIGNTSAMAPHKDYYTFIETAKILTNKNLDARFFIIGEGNLRESLEAFAIEKGVSRNIIFTGFRKNIPQLLPELDVFLITSQTEGLGTSVLDAFACKVPVVATEAGGIPELVKHEETGLSAPVKDAEKLAENILRLLTNQDLKAKLIDNAFSLVETFSKEQTSKKTLGVYQEILSK